MAALSRLRTALTDGVLVLPDGPIIAMRPPAGYDLAGLGAVHILQTHVPDQEAWARAGFDTQLPEKPGTAIVVAPRSKDLARGMIAQAAASADLIVVDGQKTDGIDSLWNAVKKRLGPLPSITKDHGRLFWFSATGVLGDWAITGPAKDKHGFYTQPGVFSDGAVDKGSMALTGALPAALPGRVADLGAGWGYLAGEVLQRDGVTALTLVEAEALALDCARLNVTDPRAEFVWADATTWTSDPFDHIVMNPPFHQGRAGDPGLGQGFIRNAAKLLKPKGSLWMVANRHLPYETTLAECFGRVEEVPGTPGFKIFHAQRPRR